MEWALLSILGAFGQALSWGLKKKALDKSGVNNITGLVGYAVAGGTLVLLYLILEKGETVHLTTTFWIATFFIVALNVLAAWTGYRALDKGALSVLMPFMSLTALAIVPIEYLLRHTVPTTHQLWGMAIVVLGAIIVMAKEKPTKDALAMAGYFSVTLICYSVASPLMGVAVNESGSGLYAAAVAHLGIAFGFIPLVFFSRESETMRELKRQGRWSRLFLWMILAGITIAVFENGPINVALENATASEVFALKRTMPFFALILGTLMFHEKITRRHMLGTALLVVGSILIILFR
ncbi:MAG: EamA family transporter [Candidatus Moraniibacteriota bacterium]